MIFIILFLQQSLSNQQQQYPFYSIIQQVNSKQNIWLSGYNKYFQNKSIRTIQSLMGALKTPQNLKLPLKLIQPKQDLPQNFSSIQNWFNCQSIKEIRDQSNCGSCWAFGAVQIISDRICIHSGQKLQTRISAADMLSCCGWCGYGCGGGYSDNAMNYWQKHGLVTGWLYNTTQYCYPYQLPPCDHHTQGKYGPCPKNTHTPDCVQKCISTYNKTYKQDRHFAQTVYRVPSKVSKIQTQIMENGPIQVQFTVYQDFLTYKKGVYFHVHGKRVGEHAVKMIGWGVQNKVEYWLIANSWNNDWGDNGFFKIKRGVNQCGIEQQGVAGIPKIQKSY